MLFRLIFFLNRVGRFILMKKTLLIFLVFVAALSISKADSNPMVGIYGGVNLNSQITDFDILPYKLADNFHNPDINLGVGSHFGITFQYPLTPIIDVGARFSYNKMSSELSKEQKALNLLLNSQTVSGRYEQRLKLHLEAFTFEPDFTFHLYKGFHLLAGLGINFPTSHREEYREKITTPDNAVFPNNTKAENPAVRKDTACKMSDVPAALLSANFGAYFDIPINSAKNLILSPGVYYNFGLTDYVKNYSWRINQAQASVGLKYAFSPNSKKTIINEQIKIDTIKISNKEIASSYVALGEFFEYSSIEDSGSYKVKNIIRRRTDTLYFYKHTAELSGDIHVMGIDKEGNIVTKPQYISEQTIENRNQPMLNYIFFDSMDYQIPDRYIKIGVNEADNFSIDSLYNASNIETYYNILNIVGYRMRQTPGATISLKGCNSQTGGEKWNQTLSSNRATAVANYLTSVWKIDPRRINILTQGLPDKYSYPANQPLKAQENRRVEIISNNYDILSPLFVNDTTIQVEPPVAKFVIDAQSSEGFKDWKINITKPSQTGGNSTLTEQGSGIPPKEKEITLKSLTDNNFNPSRPLYYSLNLSDVENNKFATEDKQLEMDKFTVQKRKIEHIGNHEIERYSLILFDFTSDELNDHNKMTIAHVKNSIKPESKVKIIGYTDVIGDPGANRALSLKRAKAAFRALGYPEATVEGRGEDEILYDNSLPEGRIFSRTVEIIIETPTHK